MSKSNSQSYCAFCGLPVLAPAVLSADSDSLADVYCCSGCQLVAGIEQAEAAQGSSARAMLKLGLGVFFAMNVMVFTMALWSRDLYPGESFDTPLAETLRSVFRWASMLFSLPVLWLLGGPIVEGVWRTLRRGMLTTDLLILMGVAAAYVYSAVSVFRDSGHVYFEVGVMVLVFVSLGRWLEAKGKRRTTESLDRLTKLLPDEVRRLASDGSFREVRCEELNAGDVIRVVPGERFPVDGLITRGQASVDQQLVTGESAPIVCSVGDRVFSGTIDLDGDVLVEVTSATGQETLTRIVAMVRAARFEKGRQERLADRIARWFVPLVCLVALAAGWQATHIAGIDQGILTSLAVVLIACPCALGLATPMAVWTALGRAAEHGVLFRSGLILEQTAEIQTACFDKTGTLTTGQPWLRKVLSDGNCDPRELIDLAAKLAEGSNHPLSRAIVAAAEQIETERHSHEQFQVQTVPGMGVTAETGLGKVVLGSNALMQEENLRWPDHFTTNSATPQSEQRVFIGWAGQIRGAFCFDEALRPDAPQAVKMCRDIDVEPRLLTGDSQARATQLGQQLHISTQADLLPEDKLQAIDSLKQTGPVAMIGDGINDAPALAAADVGVALGCGADVSRESAGVCLMGDDLRRFPWAVSLARQTSRVVKQNLFWAFSYNTVGIALAATGRLNPILAAAAMAISSLLVIANSLRLNRFADLPTHSVPAASESSDGMVNSLEYESLGATSVPESELASACRTDI